MSHSITSQQPLNQAMVQQILLNLQSGQIRKCKAMGLDEQTLKAFENDRRVRDLANSSVSWVSAQINPDVLSRLILRSEKHEEETRLIDRALRLGASNALVTRLFGMTNEEIAHRRKILDVPQRKGRWPVLSEKVEHDIWNRWTYLARENDVCCQDMMALLDVVILIAEEYAVIPMEDGSIVSLAQIWRTLECWIDQGHVE